MWCKASRIVHKFDVWGFYNSKTLCAWRQNELLIRGLVTSVPLVIDWAAHESLQTELISSRSVQELGLKSSQLTVSKVRDHREHFRCSSNNTTSINQSITWLCVFYSVVFRSLNSCKCGFGAADLLWVVSGAPSPPLHPQRLPLHSGCRLNPSCSRTGTELRTCTLESSTRGGITATKSPNGSFPSQFAVFRCNSTVGSRIHDLVSRLRGFSLGTVLPSGAAR